MMGPFPRSFIIHYKDICGKIEVGHKLYFERDYQFKAYRLRKLGALRHLANMEKLTINGIFVPKLDKRMQSIDWEAHLRHGIQSHERSSFVDLYRRSPEVGRNPGGISISTIMQYKYCPPESTGLYSKH